MRSACTLTSEIAPSPSHTTMPSGAASTSSRKSSPCGSAMRDPDAEDGARARVLDPDPAAVGLDGELAEREPEAAAGARPPALRLREALEHAGPQLLGHARPRVRDADLDRGVDRRGGERD